MVIAVLGLAPSLMSAATSTYSLDDGSGEAGFGGFATTTIWMNSFTSQAGAEYINGVSISFGANGGDPSTYNGLAIGVHVWSDPNNDGNPNDAILLQSGTGVISDFTNTSGGASTGYVDFTLDSVAHIAAGNGFFVGMSMYYSQSVFGPARDTTSDEGRSWMYRWNGDVTSTAPDNMSTAPTKQNYDDVFGGNAMIRATGLDAAPVPEPSVLSLFGIGAVAFLFRKKRP